ncbi:transglycosylase domain-containing protein [Pseudomonas aeruginosa]|uniref:transglycosylase domain-containing protein n=1 Tax=Pseudomonas aeruginosa TaxID=287 RepID=UPI00053D5996|nr:transglycosylase domain-containing protein [Pseudomonas aeruginosa]
MNCAATGGASMGASERSTNDPSELQPCSLPASASPRKSRLRQRLMLIGFALPILAAVGIVVLHEAHTSRLQARELARYAATLDYEVRQGPSEAILFPADGPFDRRLGYQLLPSFMQRLYDRDYAITRQAHFSPALMRYAEHRLFPPYAEKAQAGLDIADCRGVPIYDFRYPQRRYANFASLPPLVVQSLLFIENRDLLDHERPYLNPAVDWGRFTQAALSQVGKMLGFSAHSSGGSTLATQIEKYRHSAEGRTGSIGDKLRQMLSASVRSYREGPANFAARQDIVLTYLNSVPLSAAPGYGEVTGLADGLWVWYGADYRQVGEALDGKAGLAAQGLALRQVLALMIAHRRPSFYLAPRGRDELDRMTDSHLRVLTQAGVIEAPLRDAALAQKLAFRDPRSQPTVQPLPTNKGVTLARTRLAGMLGVPLYDLDRLDLRANTTLQHELQESVTAYLQKLADPDYAAQLGLIGERLLTPTSTRSVRYSFTLFERTPSGNQVRVQTDNTDQPFDINEGSKLELGSTAKLRVLASYLETVAQIHRDYGGMSVAELRKVEVEPLDFILRWGIDYLVASRDRDLSAMLQAAMERRYSASPYESFFTGGGLHTFNNFRKEDNGRRPMLLEALRESINLPFVRLLRDLIRHDIYQNAGSKVQLLADDKDSRRADYLDRFVDKESQVYLRRFWVKYRDKDANQRLETFLDGLRPWPVRLAAIHRYLQPQADLASFSAFLRERLPSGSLTDKRAAELYERYGPGKFNLNDQGYVARVHPLELWLLGYLQKQPQATFGEAVAASGAERKEVYGWLFKSRHKNARDKRIRILLEVEAFLDLHQQWKKLGYPFDHLVPSYATALGSSGDRPAALAELMGIIVNDGVRMPTLRLEHLDFALGTPYETRFAPEATLGQRVMTSEVATTLRNALSQVVDAGTARRLQGTFSRPDGAPLVMGGKTGTGDNRLQTFSAGGHVRSSKALNRTATFVFYIGPRHFGTLTAYVDGSESSQFKFTSALPVQVLKGMAPLLRDYLDPRTATRCQVPLSPQQIGRL